MRTLDEEIARRLQEAADSGELGSAKEYGKPMPENPAWQSTLEALRMPMKILKDAGATPPEIEWFHERARRGIGHSIMVAREHAIVAAGFRAVDIVATLAGEPLYASFGRGGFALRDCHNR